MCRECDPVEGSSGAELASRRTEPHHAVQAETTRRTGITRQDVLPCNHTAEFWCESDLVYGDGDGDGVQCMCSDICGRVGQATHTRPTKTHDALDKDAIKTSIQIDLQLRLHQMTMNNVGLRA